MAAPAAIAAAFRKSRRVVVIPITSHGCYAEFARRGEKALGCGYTSRSTQFRSAQSYERRQHSLLYSAIRCRRRERWA